MKKNEPKRKTLLDRARWALAVRDATVEEESHGLREQAETLYYGVKPYSKLSKTEVLEALVHGLEEQLDIEQ